MNINQLKYLVSVFETESITNASRVRGVSVQAVSKAVGDLEKEFGEKLFDRTSRGIEPTRIGCQVYRKANHIVEGFEELEAMASGNASPNDARPFRLALCSPSFEKIDELCASLQAFLSNATGLQVELKVAYPEECRAKLQTGELDAVATIGAVKKPGYACKVIGTLPTAVVVASSHPLAHKDVVTLADLEPYAAGESELWDTFNESILMSYRKRHLIHRVSPILHDETDHIRFMLVEHGYFFSALVPGVAQYQSGMKTLQIDEAERLMTPICLVSRQGISKPALRKIENILLGAIANAAHGA